METLSNNTAKLPPVDLVRMNEVVGRSTVESIQSGLYYGALGAAREIVTRIKQGILANQNPLVLATGGFAPLFQKENLYDHLLSDLVLHGVRIAMSMQKGKLTN
jgi:type III pantothenate kinase